MELEQIAPSFYWCQGTLPAELRTSFCYFLRKRLPSFSITTGFIVVRPVLARMLSLWTGTWHLWKPLGDASEDISSIATMINPTKESEPAMRDRCNSASGGECMREGYKTSALVRRNPRELP